MDMQAIVRSATEHGSHFFDAGSMRFFRSRLCEDVYEGAEERWYFVTSEQFRGSDGHTAARAYTVRVCDMRSGHLAEASVFQEFDTRGKALRKAAALASMDRLGNTWPITDEARKGSAGTIYFREGWREGWARNRRDEAKRLEARAQEVLS